MAGENLYIIFSIYLCIFGLDATPEQKVFIKGGLLFEQTSESLININPPTLIFTRYLNFSTLDIAINKANIFTQSYKNFCTKLNQQMAEANSFSLENRFFISGEPVELGEAYTYCRNRGAQLPEIRTILEKAYFTTLVQKHGLTMIPAGIYPDVFMKEFLFSSDRRPALKSEHIFNSILINTKEGRQVPCYYMENQCANATNTKDFVVYVARDNDIILSQVLKEYKTSRKTIVCQVAKLTEENHMNNNLLLKMAAHTCLRDIKNIEGMTSVVEQESNLFTKSKRETEIDLTSNLRNDPTFYKLKTLPPDNLVCQNPMLITNCNKMYKFIEKLRYFGANISKLTGVTDSFIVLFVIHNILKQLDLIDHSKNFKGCNYDYNLDGINKTHLNDNIIRLIEYGEQVTINCAKWPYNQETESSLKIILAKDYIKPILEIYDEFYKNDFHLTTQERIKAFKEWHVLHYGYIDEIYEEAKLNLTSNRRDKRLIGTVPLLGTIAGSNALTSLWTGSEPFSWFGSTVSKLTGLVTKSDIKIPLDAIRNNSIHINTLNINQIELENAYTALGDEINRLNNANKLFEYSTSTLMQEIDHKLGITNLQSVIQMTLLKIANSLSFAINKQASPYILSPKELSDLAIEFRARNIFLSNQMDDVKTSVYNDNGRLFFSFEIPVLEEKNLFTLYKIKPIPIFMESKIVRAIVPTEYIAYASANNEFTILNTAEHQSCKNAKYCKATDILRPVPTTQNCVIKALETNSQTCKFEEISKSEPYYKLYDDTLVYSVNGPLETRIICKESKQFKQNIFYLNGVGLLKIAQDCKIEFQNSYKAFSNPEPTVTDLGSVKMMDVFHYIPQPDNFSIEIPKYIKANVSMPTINLKKVETASFEQILNEVINPSDALPEIIRVLTAISIVIIVLLIICKFSPKFETCFKTFVLWKNPKTWWTEFRNYDIRTFEKFVNNPTTRRWIPNLVNRLNFRNEPTGIEPLSSPPLAKKYVDRIMEEELRCQKLLDTAKPMEKFHIDNERKRKLSGEQVASAPKSPKLTQPPIVGARQLYPHFTMRPMTPVLDDSNRFMPQFETTSHEQINETIILNQPTTEYFISPRLDK